MSWANVKLGEILDIARGGSPRPISDFITNDIDGVNWISIKDASNSQKYISKTKLKIKKEGVGKSRMVYPGDFLLTNSMSFGRPYIMKTEGCIHDGWLVLAADSKVIDSDYFYHVLGSDLTYKKFSALAAGAVVKNLNVDLVKSVEIPLPPLKEQKRIAAILDKADAIRRKRQQAIELADQFLRSVFLDMFGDPVANRKGIKLLPMTDVFNVTTGKLDSNAAVEGGKYPFFTCAKEVYAIDDYAFELEALLLAGNNATADYDVKNYTGKFNAYQRTYVLTLKDGDSQYGFYQFALEYQLQDLKKNSKGSNTKYITMEIMSRTYLPVPSTQQQQEFMKHLLFARKMKEKLLSAEGIVSLLTASLTQSAFEGGLNGIRAT